MQLTPLLILPGFVCLFWAGVHALLASRTTSFRILLYLFLAVFFTIAGDILLDTIFDSDAIAHIAIFTATPTIIPLTCLYFASLLPSYKPRASHFIWVILPVILATSSIILTSVMGLSETDELLDSIHSGFFHATDPEYDFVQQFYYYSTTYLFRWVMFLEVVFMLVFTIRLSIVYRFRPKMLFDFLFRKGSIRPLQIQIILADLICVIICLLLVFRHYIIHESPTWVLSISLLHSLLYFLFGFFALFSAVGSISIPEIRTAFRFNFTPQTRSQLSEEIITDMSRNLNAEALTHVLSRLGTQHSATSVRESALRAGVTPSLAAAVLNVVSLSRDEDSLAARFQRLMLSDRLYLQPGLTLDHVAEKLHTNKTYVSKMVNQTYKLGFPELLNILRVDYAQRYIRKHAEASQEELAKACGFLSASSFNSTFKRITGFTPKVWTARKDSLSGR